MEELPLPRLSISGITKCFGPTTAVHDVSLTLHSGEIRALLGENGAGKSTLVKILAGALSPDSGAMTLNRIPYTPGSPLDARSRGVVMIHQELAVAPHLSVEENIFLGVERTRCGFVQKRAMRNAARLALTELGYESLPLDTPVSMLSMSERQIVEIARALVSECTVLILDEPTSSLSHSDTHRLFQTLRRLRSSGISIIYISHFLEEIFEIADSYSVMRDGAIVGSGALTDSSPEGLAALLLGSDVSRIPAERYMTLEGEELLVVDNLHGTSKPKGATLTVRRGEIVGIAGLIGAGRTEFLRTLFGLDPVMSGSVRIAHSPAPESPAEAWHRGAGFVSEDRAGEGLAQSRSIADNIMLPRMAMGSPFRSIRATAQAAEVHESVTATKLKCTSGLQRIAELSGGNQQKAAIARLLYSDTDLFLLDEPTRGIDIRSKQQIYDILDQRIHGDDSAAPRRAAVVISSSFPELLTLCDRIAVMHRGVLGEARPVSEWNEHLLICEAAGIRDEFQKSTAS